MGQVEQRDDVCGSHWSKEKMYIGHSGAKNGCTRVTLKQSVDVHRLIVYESQISEKILKNEPLP
jgi:hypothetical protein